MPRNQRKAFSRFDSELFSHVLVIRSLPERKKEVIGVLLSPALRSHTEVETQGRHSHGARSQGD